MNLTIGLRIKNALANYVHSKKQLTIRTNGRSPSMIRMGNIQVGWWVEISLISDHFHNVFTLNETAVHMKRSTVLGNWNSAVGLRWIQSNHGKCSKNVRWNKLSKHYSLLSAEIGLTSGLVCPLDCVYRKHAQWNIWNLWLMPLCAQNRAKWLS